MSEHFQDELDRRLSAVLASVDVPTGLRSKIEQALAAAEQSDVVQLPPVATSVVESPAANSTFQSTSSSSKLFSRRNWIAASVAAGIGGALLGYRQLTQPLSQTWLVECCSGLLAQVEPDGSSWQTFTTEPPINFLREVGFLRQVRNMRLAGFCKLRPPRRIDEATAYNIGPDGNGGFLVLLDLLVGIEVQGVTKSLYPLPQSRSDAMAMAAMRAGDHLLILTGHIDLSKYIVGRQTI